MVSMSICTHADAPSTKHQCAYEYSTRCSFQALHSPNIGILVGKLQSHQDYVGFRDKVKLLSENGQEQLASNRLWDPFTLKIVSIIKSSITMNEKELNKMRKGITLMERDTVPRYVPGDITA